MKTNKVKCGICKVRLVWHWYTCLLCPDFNICATCNDLNLSFTPHGNHHPSQSVLTKDGEDMYYEEGTHKPSERTYVCPFCNDSTIEYGLGALLDHQRDAHTNWFGRIKCPICVSRCYPRVVRRLAPINLIDHIVTFHTPNPYPESSDDSDAFDTPSPYSKLPRYSKKSTRNANLRTCLE